MKNDPVCDICGYRDESVGKTVVHVGPDGLLRCKKCRHLLMYGRYIHSNDDAFERDEARDWTPQYIEMLRETETES